MSQDHQPPQFNSWWDHQDPKNIEKNAKKTPKHVNLFIHITVWLKLYKDSKHMYKVVLSNIA